MVDRIDESVSFPNNRQSDLIDIKGIFAKKFIPFSQKAAVVKLLEADLNVDGVFTHDELVKASPIIKTVRESMLSAFANCGVVCALFGITTYTALLSPLTPSTIDHSDDINHNLSRLYVILMMISTCFSLLGVFVCTWYTLVVTVLLTSDEDFVWFTVHIPSVVICFLALIIGVATGICAMSIALFIIYSFQTAIISIIIGITSLSALYIFCFLQVAAPLFNRINKKFSVYKAKILSS